jgi:hypothetical protein
MHNWVLIVRFVAGIFLSVAPFVLAYWHYADEMDWRWRNPVTILEWLEENKHVAVLSLAIAIVGFVGLTA